MKMLTQKMNLSGVLYVTALCLLAWGLGKLVVSFLDVPTHIVQPNINVQQTALLTVSPSSKVQSSYLLGRPDEIITPEMKESAELISNSRLSLKLVGVLSHPLKSLAVIDFNGKTQIFVVGDEIQRDVELIEVSTDFAVISNGGKYEKLVLKSAPNISGVWIPASSAATVTDKQSKKLDLIKTRIQKSPLAILPYVRFEFIQKEGGTSVIKVWPKQEKELFDALGFEPGDLLKSVNGHLVGELSSNPALWQTLLTESSLTISVEREGVEQNLRIDLP